MIVDTVDMRDCKPQHNETNIRIEDYCTALAETLIKKNNAYGNSLHNPISVFQKDPMAGILGRIDDKLNRIKAVGINADTEDTIEDLIGYLVHLKLILNKSKK